MKNKKKINQSSLYFRICVSFAIFCLIIIWGADITSQGKERTNGKTIIEQSQDISQNSDDEVKKMIKVLKERKESSEILIKTIQTLGNMRAEEAIPELIKYLDYEKIYIINQPKYPEGVIVDGTEIGRTITLDGHYPAVGALFQIGKPALPALVRVIEREKYESLKSQNALYAIQQIFVGDLSEGIEYLEKSMNESTSQNGKSRLQKAMEKVKEQQLKLQKTKSN